MMSLLGGSYRAAKGERMARGERQKQFAIENNQRRNAFGFGAQLLNLGSSLWDTYNENKELIDYAEKRGFHTETGTLANVFGSPEFSHAGQTVTREQVRMTRKLDEYQGSKNLLEFIDNPVSSAFEFNKNKKLDKSVIDPNERSV
jgi:hypothetical protein